MKFKFVLCIALALLITSSFAASAGAAVDEEEILDLIEQLADKSYVIRGEASDELVDIGEDALPYLIDALDDDSWRIRRGVVETLALFGDDAEDAIPALIDALEDKNTHVRSEVAKAFVSLADISEDAVPALIEALYDEEGSVRGSAAWALGEIGREPDDVIPELIEALDDEKWWVRDMACYSLAEFGTDSVPYLIEVLDEGDPTPCWHAADAIGRIGPDAEDAIDALLFSLRSSDDALRSKSAESIGKMGEVAVVAVPQLMMTLEDDEAWVRMSAVETLAKIGPYAVDAKNILIDLLYEDESKDVRYMSAVALGSIGKERGVIPALVDAMCEDNATVRDGANYGLNTLGLEAVTGLDFVDNNPVSVLTIALDSDDVELRKYAAFALGEFRSRGTPALSKLQSLARAESDDEIRWYYRDAIEKIQAGDIEEEE